MKDIDELAAALGQDNTSTNGGGASNTEIPQWYIYQDSQQFGPFNKSDIRAMLRDGSVRYDARLWREGMSGWENITDHFPPQIKPVAQSFNTAPSRETFAHTASIKKTATPIATILFSLFAIIVILVVIIGWLTMHDGKVTTNNSSGFILKPHKSKSGFTVYRHTASDGRVLQFSCWEITNKTTSPLIINEVKYNEEYIAPVARRFGEGVFRSKNQTYPVTIGIGEKASFYEYSIFDKDNLSYTKEVIFIDIETNRGHFRYNADRGFEY